MPAQHGTDDLFIGTCNEAEALIPLEVDPDDPITIMHQILQPLRFLSPVRHLIPCREDTHVARTQKNLDTRKA